ncbi:MAG TPA: alpha amylase C-terminal domain-containing protein [Thermoanaerobaculia bacterium]|nr:alpha amylase C-terminal domain-containing protein [Thermoanaerobaculia bacterium]
MPASQDHVAPDTPLGASLVAGGATFKVWAPTAEGVYLVWRAPGAPEPEVRRPGEESRLVRDDAGGTWAGFFPGVTDGSLYRFWTVGPAGEGYKRDPRARELEMNGFPEVDCVVRGPDDYPWHDDGFRPPAFGDLILYQLHIGVFYASQNGRDVRPRRVSKFLDVLGRLEYLAELGVNAIQPLPVVEWQGMFSRGYNNTDFFSPETDYALPPQELGPYVEQVNALLRKKGRGELKAEDLHSQVHQLKALIDLCHVYGLAVILDVVYNHAGGPFDEASLRFFDRPRNHEWWDADNYFIGGDGWAGGRIFDYHDSEVRRFLIDNARMFLDEYHADGFRYDEVSVIRNNDGSGFCRELTTALHARKPGALHVAEYWNDDRATAVLPVPWGLGFDAALHDGLRKTVRGALAAAAGGQSAFVDLDPVRGALQRPAGFPVSWQAVIHLENHDLVDGDRDDPSKIEPRIPALAHWDDRRDWLARSRSRVATGLLLTAPGIPMLFMGEEFLEDKPWHNDPDREDLLIHWAGLDAPGPMRDFLRFTRELCRLRHRHPALRGEGLNAYFNHNADRVLAFQRWVEGVGRDVIVVASLHETTHWSYPLPFPVGGFWHEVFNSDAYDSLPPDGGYNSSTAGNAGGVTAGGPPLQGCAASARIVIPANGLLVFARDLGKPG